MNTLIKEQVKLLADTKGVIAKMMGLIVPYATNVFLEIENNDYFTERTAKTGSDGGLVIETQKYIIKMEFSETEDDHAYIYHVDKVTFTDLRTRDVTVAFSTKKDLSNDEKKEIQIPGFSNVDEFLAYCNIIHENIIDIIRPYKFYRTEIYGLDVDGDLEVSIRKKCKVLKYQRNTIVYDIPEMVSI